MAKSAEDRLKEAVISVVEAARDLTDGEVTSIGIDNAASGEFTYRLHVPQETLPIPGIARQE